MNFTRGFANSVALPNGQVFTVGGETYPIPFDDATSVLTPEMWTPSTGQWTRNGPAGPSRATTTRSRCCCRTATVFSGGGGLCGSCATNHPDGQIYYPPYLFNADGSLATRPTITSAPSSAVTGQTISVTTGGPVQSFVMMRYDESTHAVDNDQRRIPLTITSSSGNIYQVSIPSDPGIALPGPYMLFAMDANGTPSVSSTVYISTPALSGPTDTYGQTIDSSGPAIYWPLADAAGSTGAADLSGNRDSGTFSSSGITYQTPSPVEGSGGLGVTLSGGQIVSTQPQYVPTTYSEELWFKTTTAGGVLATFGNSPTAANSDQDRIVYMTSAGQLDFGVWTGKTAVIQSPGSYKDGKWHFAVATQGSDGMRLYVDGTQVATGTTNTAQSYTGYWQLGIATNGGWPNGTTGRFVGLDQRRGGVPERTHSGPGPRPVPGRIAVDRGAVDHGDLDGAERCGGGQPVVYADGDGVVGAGGCDHARRDFHWVRAQRRGRVVPGDGYVRDRLQPGRQQQLQRGAAGAAVDRDRCGDQVGAVDHGDLDGAERCRGG